MDDMSNTLNNILSNEESMNQIRSLAQSLGLTGGGQEQSSPPLPAPVQEQNSGGNLDLSSIASMLGNLGGSNTASPPAQTPSSSSGGGMGDFLKNIDVGMLMRVQQMLSDNGDDKNANLLLAIKPHLSDERQARVDNAIRMMKLTRLLPLIKESGLFGGILDGLE